MVDASFHLISAALRSAAAALHVSNPNPRVGCLLTNAEGMLLGQGHTQRTGGPHAEVMALRDAVAQGHSVQGATAYVTLEPCSHHGRTGPCCDALIAAGIKKVVATNLDPNLLVAGQGFALLRAAGVELLDVNPPALLDEGQMREVVEWLANTPMNPATKNGAPVANKRTLEIAFEH